MGSGVGRRHHSSTCWKVRVLLGLTPYASTRQRPVRPRPPRGTPFFDLSRRRLPQTASLAELSPSKQCVSECERELGHICIVLDPGKLPDPRPHACSATPSRCSVRTVGQGTFDRSVSLSTPQYKHILVSSSRRGGYLRQTAPIRLLHVRLSFLRLELLPRPIIAAAL